MNGRLVEAADAVANASKAFADLVAVVPSDIVLSPGEVQSLVNLAEIVLSSADSLLNAGYKLRQMVKDRGGYREGC